MRQERQIELLERVAVAGPRLEGLQNLDLLIEVTRTEDFAALEDTQQNPASGALDQVIYGKIEPPLSHFHAEVNKAIGR